MEIVRMYVRMNWKLKSWSYSDLDGRVGVETWQTFITDITDLTDRPSGNPRMDVRDITAITLNMIRYDVINDYMMYIIDSYRFQQSFDSVLKPVHVL